MAWIVRNKLLVIALAAVAAWFLPNFLNSSQEESSAFRSAITYFLNLAYVLFTLWIATETSKTAIETSKMAAISMATQDALTRPSINVLLFLTGDSGTIAQHDHEVIHLEIKNSAGSSYSKEIPGSKLFLIVKNERDGGKAVDIRLSFKLIIRDPNQSTFPRTESIRSLQAGHCVAFFIHAFQQPSTTLCSLSLESCVLEFTTPFDVASKLPIQKLDCSKDMLVAGESRKSITILDGLRLLESIES